MCVSCELNSNSLMMMIYKSYYTEKIGIYQLNIGNTLL